MERSQSYEITNTQPGKEYVSTTGISEKEKALLRTHLPSHIILEDILTTSTTYLACFKCMFTEKYVQAIKWGIPIVNIEWMYDTSQNIKRYVLLPLEGSCFTTSGISNDIFKNYYEMLGSKYQENLHKSTDFVVSSSENNEKVEFSQKHGIPIIDPQNVFMNDYPKFIRRHAYDAIKEMDNGVFVGLTFFLDQGLPQTLFNALRRAIIENDGTRVSVIDGDVDYVIPSFNSRYEEYSGTIIHYQYIFDCVETKSLLLTNFYKINYPNRRAILGNVISYVDKEFGMDRCAVINKVSALGGVVKMQLDNTCTHLIVKNKRECKRRCATPYKIISSDWLDQCLYTLRYVKEDKYVLKLPTLNLFTEVTKNEFKKEEKVVYVNNEEEKIFQFSGLPALLKTKAIQKLESFNAKYLDSEKYENGTHLIMGVVATSEKFLGCLSRGGWILRPDFIDDFDNSTMFPYEKYEWIVNEGTDPKDEKIISSIKRWREKVKRGGKYAFNGWRVKLYCENPKKASYMRVLEAGGAEIIDGDDETHVFVSKKHEGGVKEPHYLPTDYIFSYLFKRREAQSRKMKPEGLVDPK
jgi:hypothetical protein